MHECRGSILLDTSIGPAHRDGLTQEYFAGQCHTNVSGGATRWLLITNGTWYKIHKAIRSAQAQKLLSSDRN